MKIYENINQVIGHTPLIRLNRLTAGTGASIAVKLEYMNPAGSVKDRPALSMIETAEQEGLIDQDMRYGGLSLTDATRPVLRGEETFEGRIRDTKTKRKTGAKRSKTKSAAPTDYDTALFEKLREKRKALADAKDVPPYVVFSNRSLKEMAARLPTDLEAFHAIHGVGQKKLEVYGETFVGLIAEYVEEQ